MYKKVLSIITIIIISIVLVSCGGGKKELPEVSEFALEEAKEFAKEDDLVIDASAKIGKNGDKIIIAIQAVEGITEEKAKEIGENTARFLAGIVEGLEGPKGDYLGELYDYYGLRIGVADESPDEPLVLGAKAAGASRIKW